MAHWLRGGLLRWLTPDAEHREEGTAAMVTMTEPAGALLARIQTERALPHPLRVDLRVNGGAFTIGLTDPTPGDALLYHGGTLVLYVSPTAADALADCTLTTQTTPRGPALAVEVPPAAAAAPAGEPSG
jgi:hypothetical protein